MGLGLMTCGERENSSVESILSFGGVVQVYHELRELEEEDKGREEVQEIRKGESSRGETLTWT